MDKITIINTLTEMGMPAGLKGFTYIVDAIQLLDKPEWKDPKWTALYYCVGTLHDTSAASVERAIRNALRITRDRNCNFKAIETYIGFANCENSNSLMQLYNKLSQKKSDNDIVITKFMLRRALLDVFNFSQC